MVLVGVRLQQLKGRVRKFMTTFILIHGIGNQDPELKWFYEAIDPLKDTTLYGRFLPFYWEDLRQPVVRETLTTARTSHNPTKVNVALSAVMDLLTYRPTLQRVKIKLNELINSIQDDVVLVAHSLGSVLAYEYIKTSQHPKIKGLVTLGSPIGRRPVSTRLKNRLIGGITPLHLHWVNISGSLDYVTTWLPWFGVSIKEAHKNVTILGQTHDLTEYLNRPQVRSILEGFLLC